MKPKPILILLAILGCAYFVMHMVGACIAIVGIGLGASPGLAVVAGFFIALGLAIHALTSGIRK